MQGRHALTLRIANALHESCGPKFMKTISVIVELWSRQHSEAVQAGLMNELMCMTAALIMNQKPNTSQQAE